MGINIVKHRAASDDGHAIFGDRDRRRLRGAGVSQPREGDRTRPWRHGIYRSRALNRGHITCGISAGDGEGNATACRYVVGPNRCAPSAGAIGRDRYIGTRAGRDRHRTVGFSRTRQQHTRRAFVGVDHAIHSNITVRLSDHQIGGQGINAHRTSIGSRVASRITAGHRKGNVATGRQIGLRYRRAPSARSIGRHAQRRPNPSSDRHRAVGFGRTRQQHACRALGSVDHTIACNSAVCLRDRQCGGQGVNRDPDRGTR